MQLRHQLILGQGRLCQGVHSTSRRQGSVKVELSLSLLPPRHLLTVNSSPVTFDSPTNYFRKNGPLFFLGWKFFGKTFSLCY